MVIQEGILRGVRETPEDYLKYLHEFRKVFSLYKYKILIKKVQKE